MKPSYWDEYYANTTFEVPSPFCAYVVKRYLQKTDSVIEIGCGEGRDGIEISKHVSNYVGIDKSKKAIIAANRKLEILSIQSEQRKFGVGTFEDLDLESFSTLEGRLVVYSRFSLHADNEHAEDRLISTLKKFDEMPLLVLIEVRTIFDDLYGVGKMVDKNAFISDHYRRFIDPKKFLSKIEGSFKLLEFNIARGLAKYGTEDPMVLRVAFEK